jgi:methyltransferase (TIGR00027 family)
MISRRRFLGGALAAAAANLGLPGQSEALEEGRPSRTAESTALQRAAHQLLESPRVFDDPLALRIFGARGVAWLGHNLHRYRTASSRAMRAFLVMRSRLAEDELARAVRGGTRQYVVLGAGLDTFAYRNPHRRVRVYEVDHPSTQEWKRRRLADSGIERPGSLAFAPVDFERQSLGEGLHKAGFRTGAASFVSWLGVTIYLTRPAVMDTLHFVATHCAKGSGIVFDFALPPEALAEAERKSRAAAAARVARVGEPWITFFDPAELAAEMRAMGYRATRVIATEEANDLYFRDRADGFRLYGSGRMMAARV